MRFLANPPSRNTLSTKCLPDIYDLFHKHILNYIESNVRFFALTSDLWSDSFQHHSYLSLTIHFSSDDFKLHEMLLAMKYVPVRHTADNIAEIIEGALNEFNLNLADGLLVTDNGSNMIAAARKLGIKRRSCLAHCLHNLVAKDTISHSTSLVKIVKKCRSIYSALLYKKDMLKSEQERAILEELVNVSSGFESFNDDHLYVQNAPSSSRESIKNDTDTRWNSTLIMLRSILHNKDAIRSCLSKLDKYELIIT